MVDLRNNLINKSDTEEDAMKIKEIEESIAEIEAEENNNLVMKHFKTFSDNPEYINLKEVWSLLKKVCPKYGATKSIAKRNFKGKIETNPSEIKKLLAKEYRQRLRPRPALPDLGDIKLRKHEIFDLQLKQAINNPSSPWTMSDLDRALADLKNSKSRDHSGCE